MTSDDTYTQSHMIEELDGQGIVRLNGVTKWFDGVQVLRGVTHRFIEGRTTVVLGPSGCGKTVMLKHIVGLLRPDRGEVYFEGRRIDTLNEKTLVPIRRQISFVFQLNALFDSLTVGENVGFPMTENTARQIPKAKIRELGRRCLDIVGLAGFESKIPPELSGGEKKRVALARAIAMDPPPKIILYDEPTTGLAPPRADVINKLIRHLQHEVHVTSVVVTHDMKSALEVGDRILMLYNGRFVADDSPQALLESESPVVKRFIEGVAEPEELATLSRHADFDGRR